MAEKVRYPQIPSTVWWGVRSILQRTPNATIDERLLGIQLSVQEVAARAYIGELRSVGLLTEEGKPTPLAHKWRLDESYAEAADQLVKGNYPESLIHVAPPGEPERQKVVSWFMREGLGQGAAGNKAATYLLISSVEPNDAPKPAAKGTQANAAPRAKPGRRQESGVMQENKPASRTADGGAASPVSASRRTGGDAFPLNINVQIHISADAGSEQIESIFQAMRRYLYDAPNS